MLNISRIEPEEVIKIIESVPKPIKEDAMTTYSLLTKKYKQEGRQEGEQIGIQIGEQIGIQKEKIDVVLKSYDNGISITLISNITNLSEEEVRKILKENGREV